MMIEEFDLCIFDMDGTLLDTSRGILEAVRHTLHVFGKNIPAEKTLKAFIGPPLKQSFLKLPDVESSECDKLVSEFREVYAKKYLLQAKLYDGILELCERMDKEEIQMAIATYKPQKFAERLAEHFNLRKFMRVILGSDLNNTLTKMDIIQKVLGEVQVSHLSRVVYIGDTYSDAEAAAGCNIKFIGAAYGFGLKACQEDLEHTHAIKLIRNPLEVYS